MMKTWTEILHEYVANVPVDNSSHQLAIDHVVANVNLNVVDQPVHAVEFLEEIQSIQDFQQKSMGVFENYRGSEDELV